MNEFSFDFKPRKRKSGYDRFLAVENAILYEKSFHFRYIILFIGQINLHGVK